MINEVLREETPEENDIKYRVMATYSWRDLHKLLMELTEGIDSIKIQKVYGYPKTECDRITKMLNDLRKVKVLE